MRMPAVVLLLLCVSVFGTEDSAHKSVIEIPLSLKTQVNAETLSNSIPWCSLRDKTDDIQIKGTFLEESILSKTIKGNYSYTIYQLAYTVAEVQKGEFSAKTLTFLIERKFPTPESGIMYKELWPFRKNTSLLFQLTKKGIDHYLITSIEKPNRTD